MPSRIQRLTRRPAFIALGFGILLSAAPAQAADEPLFELPAAIAGRVPLVRAKVEELAARVKPGPTFRSPKEFCTNSASPSALPLWKKISAAADRELPRKRKDLIPALAYAVRACGYSEDALKNAAFTLDYMYWNRIADTTGEEVADTLKVRDLFYELLISAKAQHLVDRNLAAFPKEAGKCSDFIDAGPMGRSGLLRAFGKILNILNDEQRAVVDAVADSLNLRDQMLTIFGEDMIRVLENPDDVRVMNDFYAYLLRLQQNPRLLGEPHGGWKKLLEISNGDQQQAIRVVGVLATMRFWPMDEMGYALAKRGTLKPEQLRALHAGNMTYFIINQLDERSAWNADDGSRLKYQFFYPEGYTTSDWKIYHWYANAFLGCKLARKGFKPSVVKYGVKSLAMAYEAVTLNLGGPSRVAMNVDPRVDPILEGYDDVRINTDGGVFGARLCEAETDR